MSNLGSFGRLIFLHLLLSLKGNFEMEHMSGEICRTSYKIPSCMTYGRFLTEKIAQSRCIFKDNLLFLKDVLKLEKFEYYLTQGIFRTSYITVLCIYA